MQARDAFKARTVVVQVLIPSGHVVEDRKVAEESQRNARWRTQVGMGSPVMALKAPYQRHCCRRVCWQGGHPGGGRHGPSRATRLQHPPTWHALPQHEQLREH